MNQQKILWQPDEAFIEQSNLRHFMKWLAANQRAVF